MRKGSAPKSPVAGRVGQRFGPFKNTFNLCEGLELNVASVTLASASDSEARRIQMTLLSGIGGAILIAIGSNFVVPIGTAAGGLLDLAGVASVMMCLGLIDGE
jgi:hypothetical protein